MKGKSFFKLGALCAIFSLILVAPSLGQGRGDMGQQIKEHRLQVFKSLNLAPDKEKALLAVEDKYEAQRKELGASLKKTRTQLQAAVSVANPDEAKIKDLVSALTAGQDKMFASFKEQRDEELALMTPVQQGKYLAAMSQWFHQLKQKSKGKK